LSEIYAKFDRSKGNAALLRSKTLQELEQTVVAWQDNSSAREFVCSLPECLKSITIPLPNTQGEFSSEHTAVARACCDCEHVLLRQKERLYRDATEPAVVKLYDELSRTQRQIEEYLPRFHSLMYRLNAEPVGVEGGVDIQRARHIRKSLMDAFNNLDLLSKKILQLPATTPTETKLHQAIRFAVAKYLQQHMFPLSMLPKVLQKPSADPRGTRSTTSLSQHSSSPNPSEPRIITYSALTGDDRSVASSQSNDHQQPQKYPSGPQIFPTESAPALTQSLSSAASSTTTAATPNKQRSTRSAPLIHKYQMRQQQQPRPSSVIQSLGSTVTDTVGGTISTLASYVRWGGHNGQLPLLSSSSSFTAAAEIDPEREGRAQALDPKERQFQLRILREQHELIVGFIREATKQRRLDDVRTLTENLLELEAEMAALERYIEPDAGEVAV
ncbi:carboxypeptidase Y-deficient, partial [Spiromyces aspiralis]